jgi:glycosyltransferase involved in cell wall biosynthesis
MVDITVCIPSYNAESTIAETIESFISQKKRPYKIKIFDNLSTDRTREIINEYVKKHDFITLYSNEYNLGGEGNFTKCLLNGEADYTVVAHSDDVYHPDYLIEIELAFQKFPNSVAAFPKAQFIDENSNLLSTRFHPSELQKELYTQIEFNQLYSMVFKYSNFITCPSVVVKTSVFKNEIKNWNGTKFKTSADLDVWLRVAEFGSIISINKVLIYYRFSTASYSFRIAKKRTQKHDLFIVLDYYKNKYPTLFSLNQNNYEFLERKDFALVALNKMRAKEKLSRSDLYNLNFHSFFQDPFVSLWHFKFSVSILIIFFISRIYSLVYGVKND